MKYIEKLLIPISLHGKFQKGLPQSWEGSVLFAALYPTESAMATVEIGPDYLLDALPCGWYHPDPEGHPSSGPPPVIL